MTSREMTVRARINGSLLGHYIGQQVVLLGRIKKTGSSGKSVELMTTDDVPVAVTLPHPVDGNPDGYVEVRGVAQSKSTMMGESFIHLSDNFMEEFDAESYNDFTYVCHVLGEKKWDMS